MELFVGVLAFAAIPTVVGLIRLWRRYLRVRHLGDQWLLQLFCIIATLVTPVVLYISWASANRLLGNPALPQGVALGALSAVIIAAVVPIIELRIQMWISGNVPDPARPVTPDEHREPDAAG